MELSNNSYQRQLVAEKKKTLSAQEEIKNLHEEVERLAIKLKVQRREILNLGTIAALISVSPIIIQGGRTAP